MKRISILFTAIILLVSCTEDTPFALHNNSANNYNNALAPYKMTRAEAINLILSQGVGYGYNGIEGEECNVFDVRSQVLEPNAIINAGIMADINKIEGNKVHFSSSTGFSLNELLEKVYFGGNGSAELSIIFKGSIRGTLMLYNNKKINSYYCTACAVKNGILSTIDGPSVSAEIIERPELLTKNFRSAIARLGQNPSKMQMDSLINRYGTHVVTKCTLGGMLNLDVRLEKDSIVSISQQNAIGEVALMSLFNHDSQSSNDEYDLKIINSGDSRLTVRGGDSRKLEQTLMNFNWGRDAVKPQDIDDWLESIGTDEDKRQTLEMTSMEMMPIWEFIPDPHVAKMLEAHITGNAQLMFELYGYQNFVNTSFPAFFQNDKNEQWFFIKDQEIIRTAPKIKCYNIEAGGRYIATLCLEQIPEIDVNEPVWVAYPIYQQEVNISTGLCIHNGKAYRVGWKFGEMVVTPIMTDGVTDRIYLTGGYLYPLPTQGIEYETSRVIMGYEWPGSIKTDGKLDTGKTIYTTYKENDKFYLQDMEGTIQRGQLSAIPNWTFSSVLNRMVRDNNYSYYYNPQEVSFISNHPDLFPDRITIKTNGSFTGRTSKPVVVSNGVTLSLHNANINNDIIIDDAYTTLNLESANIYGQIDCRNKTSIYLKPGTSNNIDERKDGLSGIRVYSILTINGDGELNVYGGDWAAGIGSNMDEGSDDRIVLIEGGHIYAQGGDYGAGIGAGKGKSIFGQVIIHGGDIEVRGGKGAAGIGSGSDGSSCGLITIADAKVVAYGGHGGAAIGSGANNSEISGLKGLTTLAINFLRANVRAYGGNGASGIGSGANKSSCEEIKIRESDIESYGEDGGAGIGSGIDNSICGNIQIEGSNIEAFSFDGGAGIGSGRSGKCSDIILKEAKVWAQSTRKGAGIGSGKNSSSCGNIKILSSDIETIASFEAAAIGSGYNSSSCGNIYIGLVQDGEKPSVIYANGSIHTVGAGEESTCGETYIHPTTIITQ